MPNEAEEKLARGELSDIAAAEAVRDGLLPSPTKYEDFWLFDLRITGTGAAWRDRISEFAYRSPEKWLTEDVLKQVAGLSVIFDHPESGGLNSEEYRERSLGSIFLPYIKGEEIWGVAKIFDQDGAKLMQTTHRSTSPGVTTSKGSLRSTSESGKTILHEETPRIFDHLAICERGVWDLGSPDNLGVRLDSIGKKERQKMTLEEEEKLRKDHADALRRADSAEAEVKKQADARKDAEEKEKAEKDRKDAEESERKAVEEEETKKADKKRKDRADRHDAEKHGGDDHADCSKCDAAEMSAEDKAKADAAAKVENVSAEVKELKDSIARKDAEMKTLQDSVAALSRQPSIEDANAIATAFHRADSAYQMLGEAPPKSYPGESSIAYRRRLADGLRKHSSRFKDEPISDSLVGQSFDLTEGAIYADALEAAKNPPKNDSVETLREVSTTTNGKTRTQFYGSSRVAFAPFAAPVMSFKFKAPSAIAGRA